MFKIWCIEANGDRVLVRDDVSDPALARALVCQGNNGARIRCEAHCYLAEPDPAAPASPEK